VLLLVNAVLGSKCSVDKQHRKWEKPCENVVQFIIIKKLTLKFDVTTNYFYKFKVCKSVHHRTIQINHQPDATTFQFIILTFIYSSTCFGRSIAHHQELMTPVAASGFAFRIVMIAVLCSWSGR
jgi:hypothetical protein